MSTAISDLKRMSERHGQTNQVAYESEGQARDNPSLTLTPILPHPLVLSILSFPAPAHHFVDIKVLALVLQFWLWAATSKDLIRVFLDVSKAKLKNCAGYDARGNYSSSTPGEAIGVGFGGSGNSCGQTSPERTSPRKNLNPKARGTRSSRDPCTNRDESRHFACPYYLFDRVRFRLCRPWHFESITRLQQHLKRSHLEANICPRCRRVFNDDPNEDEYNAHILEYTCRPRGRAMPPRTMNVQKWNQIQGLNRQHLPDQERWLLIWNILFDSAPHPVSIYYIDTDAEPADRLSTLLARFEQHPQGQVALIQNLVVLFPQLEGPVSQIVTYVFMSLRSFAAQLEQLPQGQHIPLPVSQQLPGPSDPRPALQQQNHPGLAPGYSHQPAFPHQPLQTYGDTGPLLDLPEEWQTDAPDGWQIDAPEEWPADDFNDYYSGARDFM